MDAIEKSKCLEQRAKQVAKERKAERIKVWQEIQQKNPAMAEHLKELSRVFGKPDHTNIWIDDRLIWPVSNRKKTP